MFFKKATKFDKIFTVDLTLTKYIHTVKSTVKISSIFVAFLEDTNFQVKTKREFFLIFGDFFKFSGLLRIYELYQNAQRFR